MDNPQTLEDLQKLLKEKEEKLNEKENEIQKLQKNRLGLYWDKEREPEQVVLDCENNLPILKRVKEREIKNGTGEDNILIEGDNFHALTCLNYTHKGKIDVIYIDPPYNTGNKDFKYNDRFIEKEDGYRHSKWLNFMEKRLILVKSLLKETGVIFISIDDNEQANLKLLCDKIFGRENFIANFIWNTKKGAQGMATKNMVVPNHEYVLVYAKITTNFKFIGLERSENGFKNPDNDSRGLWKRQYLQRIGQGLPMRTITNPETNKKYSFETPYTQEKLDKWVLDNTIIFPKKKDGYPIKKEFLNQYKNKEQLITSLGLFPTKATTEKLYNLFNKIKIFTNPKPDTLIKFFIEVTTKKEAIILDFFAGSGTTADAVMQVNAEDGGNRKFILCTNNENKICKEVTYPRIEKVMNGYAFKEKDKKEGLGGNLHYFKTDFIKKTKSRDRLRLNLTQKCTQMLCIKESIFTLEKKEEDYKIFTNSKKDRFLCIYYHLLERSFDGFCIEVKKLKGRKFIYMFSLDKQVDKSLFFGINNFSIEPIPENILNVYQDLVKMTISIKKNLIFSELSKAKSAIFERKDKDDGAKNLRVVLEKLLQKICQNNNINTKNDNNKEKSLNILNQDLYKDKIITQLEYQENTAFLVIGNKASHGDYDEYDLAKVEDFYRNFQKLIDRYIN